MRTQFSHHPPSDSDVNVNAVDNAGWTALHEACGRGQLACVRVLLRHGADPNRAAENGRCPLHDAAAGNDVEVGCGLN